MQLGLAIALLAGSHLGSFAGAPTPEEAVRKLMRSKHVVNVTRVDGPTGKVPPHLWQGGLRAALFRQVR